MGSVRDERRSWSGVALAAAALAGVAVVVGSAGPGSLVPPLTGAARGAASPSPSPPATRAPHEAAVSAPVSGHCGGPKVEGFRPVRLGRGARPVSVTGDESGFVLGGSVVVATGVGHLRWPAVWTSADGCTWQRAELPPRADGWDDRRVTAVAHAPAGLVAIGLAALPGRSEARTRPAAWFSTDDGRTWQRAEVRWRGPFGAMTGLRATPTGIVAWGTEYRSSARRTAVVWRSTDARHWVPVTAHRALAPATGLCTITSDGGVLVATGEGPSGVTVGHARWDGTGWSRQRVVRPGRCERPETDLVSRARRVAIMVAPNGGPGHRLWRAV